MVSEQTRRQQRVTRTALLLPVYVPTALLAFGQGLLLPILPAYARSFGVSFGLASLAIAAAGIGTLLADVPAGMLLGRLGLRPTMLIGAGLTTAATVAAGLAQSFPELLAYRLLAGVGMALWGLSRHAYITETIDPRQRGQAISVFGGINRIGMFSGPAIGGFVGSAVGLTAPFFLSGILGIAALIVSFMYVTDTRVVTHTDRRVRWALVGSMIRTNGRDLSAAAVAQVFAQVIRAGRQALIPFYAEAVLGLNVAQIGTIQSASSVVDMAMFIPAGLMMDRFGRKTAAVPSFAVMAVGMACIPLTDSYLTLLGAAMVIGFGNGLGSGTMMTLGADLAPVGATGEFLGIWRLIGDTGAASGPLVVGVLTDAIGFDATAYVLAGFGVAAALTLALLVRETRIAPAPT
jgi:MFS family permease